MSKTEAHSEIHPDAVLEALLAKGGRSQRIGNLQKVHEICRRLHAGTKDLSIASVGRVCEAEGVLKGRVLYNATSGDYVILISAWAGFLGMDNPKRQAPPQSPVSHEFLMRIEDPAIRSIMQATIVERDRLRAQLNMLKSHTEVVIDRRPLGAALVPGSNDQPIAVFTIGAQLTDSERESLKGAISEPFLRDQGWREGLHGEIVTEKGRTLFNIGFTNAIRKVLGVC